MFYLATIVKIVQKHRKAKFQRAKFGVYLYALDSEIHYILTLKYVILKLISNLIHVGPVLISIFKRNISIFKRVFTRILVSRQATDLFALVSRDLPLCKRWNKGMNIFSHFPVFFNFM